VEPPHGQSGNCCTTPHSSQFDLYFLVHVLWFVLHTASFRFPVFMTLTDICCLYSICSLHYMEVSFMPCVWFLSLTTVKFLLDIGSEVLSCGCGLNGLWAELQQWHSNCSCVLSLKTCFLDCTSLLASVTPVKFHHNTNSSNGCF